MSVDSALDTTTKWCGGEEKLNNLEHGKKHAKEERHAKVILCGSYSLCGLFNQSSTN